MVGKALDPKLFVALDVDAIDVAIQLSKELSMPQVGFKIGPRLVNRYGSKIIKDIAGYGPVFVDLKFFDIPSTMTAAVRAIAEAGANYVTVHAVAGKIALQELCKLEAEVQSHQQFRILAVTVLTSSPLADLVVPLAKDVFASGLLGVVASAHEAKAIKELNPKAFIVTPGIRPKGSDANDQSRVVTPEEAWQNGATALVVGRPILEAKNKRLLAETILKTQ